LYVVDLPLVFPYLSGTLKHPRNQGRTHQNPDFCSNAEGAVNPLWARCSNCQSLREHGDSSAFTACPDPSYRVDTNLEQKKEFLPHTVTNNTDGILPLPFYTLKWHLSSVAQRRTLVIWLTSISTKILLKNRKAVLFRMIGKVVIVEARVSKSQPIPHSGLPAICDFVSMPKLEIYH